MIELERWKLPPGIKKPALVIGKGPTVDRLAQVDLGKYIVFTLNHAIRVVPRTFGAHFIDWEAYQECCDSILDQASYVFMPMVLHRNSRLGPPVAWGIDHCPRLNRLNQENRLVVYMKTPAAPTAENKGLIRCRYFSAEAMFDILGYLGWKVVDSIGVDGGTGYASSFADLTPLTNGRPSFDIQMGALSEIAKQRNIKWTRLFADAEK